MYQELKDILVHLSKAELKQAILMIQQEIALKERKEQLVNYLQSCK